MALTINPNDQELLKNVLSCLAAHEQLANFISFRNNDFEKARIVINNYLKFQGLLVEINYDSDSFFSGQKFTDAILEEITKQKVEFPACVERLKISLIKRHWFYSFCYCFKQKISIKKPKFFDSTRNQCIGFANNGQSSGLINTFSQAEHDLIFINERKYQDFSSHAVSAIKLIETSISILDNTRANDFLLFYAVIYKHYMLGLLSTLRQQSTQANLNIRHILEAGACAAYLLAEPQFYDQSKNIEIDLLNDKIREKAYKWLNENGLDFASYLKNDKKIINSSYAHVGGFVACGGMTNDPANISFLDEEDPNVIQLNLWHLGNIVIALMQTFYEINQTYTSLKFHLNFEKNLQALIDENNLLKKRLKINQN